MRRVIKIAGIRRCLSALLCFSLVFSLTGTAYAEDYTLMMPFTLTVYIGDNAQGVRAYHAGYRNNVYLSLLDLSRALDGTKRQFSIVYGNTAQDGEYHSLYIGQPYNGDKTNITQTDYDQREDVWLVLRRNRIFVDGEDKKYYTCREGGHDLYMSFTDLQLMLDFTITNVTDTGIRIEPDVPFMPVYSELAEAGAFDYLFSYLVADANNGTVVYGRDLTKPFSIASTTKLMTYLLVAEAMEKGVIRAETEVMISEHAAEVSQSADGIIPLEIGQIIPVSELIDAMLVASSNESAHALAECVSGSVEAFVALMNRRAQEFGLSSAKFYSPDGLPVYTQSSVPVKLQNVMSTQDLFRLSAYVISRFPAVTAITSRAYVSLPAMKYTTANSNPLIFNMKGVNGLKTGSTNRAGYCLVATMPVTTEGKTHTLLLIILGAENAAERGQVAELLLRCAIAETK